VLISLRTTLSAGCTEGPLPIRICCKIIREAQRTWSSTYKTGSTTKGS
jgi:hypothetical protein